MRIISGCAGGRSIETLSGSDIVRPTSERVKEGVFSSIQFMIEGRRFLDLFAGSGQMGIEALSRGAAHAVFVDSNKTSVNVIKSNLLKTGLSAQGTIINTDSVSFATACRDKFDIVFLDPPYGSGLLQTTLPLVERLMNTGGKIICECPLNEELPEHIGDFSVYKNYRYGKIKITAYVHNSTL